MSAGVAVLFSPSLAVSIISQKEVCKGRLLKGRANIKGQIFVFFNIYVHNTGSERAVLFGALRQECPSSSARAGRHFSVGRGFQLYH